MNLNNIPLELRQRKQWVVHRAKMPYGRNGETGPVNKPSLWMGFHEATKLMKEKNMDGLGFCLQAPYVGVDMDHCTNEQGGITPFALDIVERCNSYTELSPSKTGIHVIGKGTIPKAMRTNAVEVYSEGRYFTMTGNVWPGRKVIRPVDLSWLFPEEKEALAPKPDGWVIEQLEAITPGEGVNGRTPTFVRVIGRLKGKGLGIAEVVGLLQPWAEKYEYTDRIVKLVEDQYKRYPLPALPPNANASSIDVFLEDQEAVEWICPGIIAQRTIGFVAGLPETGKTWLLIDLAVECAKGGGSWLGKFPVRGAKVLFIDQERFKGETQRRFKKVIAGKQMSITSVKETLFVKCGSTTRLDLQHSFEAFKKELNELRPDLVIVDSFATFQTADENNRMAIQQTLERIKELRNEFGCTFIFIDHESKLTFSDSENKIDPSYSRMVGSIAKPAAAEFILTVRKQDQDASMIYNTKNSLASSIAPFLVKVEDVEEGIAVRGY